MGKPVRIRRGIATVIPDCASTSGQPDRQPEKIPNVCDLQTAEPIRMTYIQTPRRGKCRSALALLTLLAQSPAQAEEKNAEIPPLIVSALRVPRDPATVTSAVTALEPEELENRGIYQLRDALNAVPGVISTSTGGQTGAVGTLFIRGTGTAYSQVVIDGMRLSDSTVPLGNILAASRVSDVGTIEILRGPQGAIHGGESIGGILWMETPRGIGTPGGRSFFEAGSFHSLTARSLFQGTTGGTSYYLSGGYEESDNDGPNEDFHQGNTALRVEHSLDEVLTLGTTFRAIDGYYNDHGTSENRVDSALGTLYAVGKISDRWTARMLAGYHQEFYDNDSSFGNYGSDIRAGSLSTDHEITLAENLRLLAGGYFHNSAFENTIGTDTTRDRFGIHSVLEWDPCDALTLTGALRWEDYQAYGDELTWRLGGIYQITPVGTSIRGGIGTSFRSPSFLDLFGSSFGEGNPDLDAESSIGWDIGIEQKIGVHHTLEATWFNNRITDRIQSFPTPPVNLSGVSETNGLEFGLRGNFPEPAIQYLLAWTHLHQGLSDPPKNAASTSITWKPDTKSLLGIGATHFSDHSWGGDPLDGYTVVRLHGSYQLTDRIKLHARIENLLDESYQLASFFGSTVQGAGTGYFAGVTLDW
jgi:vitamin B12 transporter